MKHDLAKMDFWVVFFKKTKNAPSKDDYESAINYVLDKLPTWAVSKATGWLKDWQR